MSPKVTLTNRVTLRSDLRGTWGLREGGILTDYFFVAFLETKVVNLRVQWQSPFSSKW